jgi:hypothetical protein
MNCNCSFLLLSSFQELLYDIIWRWSAIQKIKIEMVNPGFNEFLSFILWFIESNYKLHSELFKDWDIVLWSKTAVFISNIQGSTKGNKFLGQYPI